MFGAPVIKIAADGEVICKAIFGGFGFQIAERIIEREEGYLVAGRTGRNMFFSKMTLKHS